MIVRTKQLFSFNFLFSSHPIASPRFSSLLSILFFFSFFYSFLFYSSFFLLFPFLLISCCLLTLLLHHIDIILEILSVLITLFNFSFLLITSSHLISTRLFLPLYRSKITFIWLDRHVGGQYVTSVYSS